MNRDEMIANLDESHTSYVAYIKSLTDDGFTTSRNNKWSAGQQLDHILRSVQPLAKVLNTKSVMQENFGTTTRPSRSYDEVIRHYTIELEKGGKATGRFLPKKVSADQKKELIGTLLDQLNQLTKSLGDYTDDELDQLVIPHPLLGNLTIREMIYFTTYHVTYHHKSTKKGLERV